MGEQTLTVEVEGTYDPSALSELIGNQMVLDGDGGPFAYLAGISFDGMDNDNNPVDILLEFFENEQSFEFTDEELDELASLLRDAYDG